MTPEALETADRLDQLAQQELKEVESFLATVPPIGCAVLLIEACRCIDHAHVIQLLSKKEEAKLSAHDFDILVRGWNVLFGLLMQRKGVFAGVPLKNSGPEIRQSVMGMMHFAGRYVILNRTAEMLRHGMVSAKVDGNIIDLRLSDRTLSDHFHDQVDHQRFAKLSDKLVSNYKTAVPTIDSAEKLRDVMGRLTFPWKTSQGIMVGYGATPEIDTYFLEAVIQDTLQWRADAGIHPSANLGDCSGDLLTGVVHVLMSFYMKHVMFVDAAITLHPGINQHMSLTIWTTRAELINSLRAATGAAEREVAAALDFLTVRASDYSYFLKEQAPGIPLVIELSDGHLLTPVSGIFRNPFNGIRMLRESTSILVQNAFRKHREEWMAEDLYSLFEGPRFQCVQGQTKLRSAGKVVTDIDAAIFDNATNDLMLFQLKWQDFTSSSVRIQRSKAKNFSAQVQDWADKVTSWIDQYGVLPLCRALKVKLPGDIEPRHVRLIAIGRTNARFRSYGYSSGSDVLVVSWSQFARLRLVIGPGQNFFELLMRAVQDESAKVIDRKPMPYVLERGGLRINFEDIWSGFEDREDSGNDVGTSDATREFQ